MKREQAKIIGQLSDEQLKAVGDLVGRDYVRDVNFIRAYGDGLNIEARLPYQVAWFNSYGNYFGTDAALRIVTPKITFNGVEIDAPIREMPFSSTPVWTWVIKDGAFRPHKVTGRSIDESDVQAGCVFVTEDACQLYCDTHNKMMGIE